VTSAREPLIGLLCVLALAGGACADYALVPELVTPNAWLTGNSCYRGGSFAVQMVLYSDASPADSHTSGVFTVQFSRPGLQYDGYSWASPYVTGGEDDFSAPANGDLPQLLDVDTYVSDFADPGAVDIYFENFVAGDEAVFTTGTLLSLNLSVPADYPTGEIVITAVEDSFDGDQGPVPTTGQSLSVWVVLNGDRDGSGFIGQMDLDIVLDSWGQAVPPADARADADGDGIVGQMDLDAVLDGWGRQFPAGAAQQHAPEPTTGCLLLGGAALLAWRRRSA